MKLSLNAIKNTNSVKKLKMKLVQMKYGQILNQKRGITLEFFKTSILYKSIQQ